MATLKNIPFHELHIGKTASLTRTITQEDLILFATASGDHNPIHFDADYATNTIFKEPIAHGMLSGSLISCALATHMPGAGVIYLSQTMQFVRPVKINDTVTVQLEIMQINEKRKRVTIQTNVINQHNQFVVKGQAEVLPTTDSIQVESYKLPKIHIEEHDLNQQSIK